MGYDVPHTYAELVEPRYAPIADALVTAARPTATDDVLELGAGTGLVTRRIAREVRSLVATDLSAGMLDVARRSLDPSRTQFAILDYTRPLPFLDASFDLVLSGLTYVQDTPEPVEELARVLRPGGRFALAMWGPSYHELGLLSDAVESIGRPPLPSPRPASVVRRLERAGFHAVTRHDFDLANEFEDVDDYLEYRRGFGMPPGASRAFYQRYLRAIRRRASEDRAEDGSLTIRWMLTIITAVRSPVRQA